jgi:two-component system, OmpR family, alkaline phosphatase synthesis response regulator PhoP
MAGVGAIMAKEKILVVEDDEDIQELIRFNLSKEGYQISCVARGEKALPAARAQIPNLILLDLMLPGMDGLDVCKQLRRDATVQAIPIVMLTAKGEESDIVTGLEVGADDYITKPFSPKVLIARLRNVLRRKARPSADEKTPIRIHELVIDPGRHEVLVKGKPLDLTFTEFRVLQVLAARPGWVFTRNQIVDAVRGEDYAVTDRAVDVQIVGLRRKLGPCDKYIETVRGVGYRFKE